MENSTLKYAKNNIDVVAQENGINCWISEGKLYIELPGGRNFELSESEIKYQATEFLKSEIENVKYNF